MNKNKYIIKILKYFVVFLIFFFILRYLYLNINSFDFSNIAFKFNYLLLSITIYIFYLILNAIIWYVITRQNNCEITLFETVKLRIYSDFGKYIPGKVFTYGILLYGYGQKNISKKKIAVCSFLELILSILSAIIISLISISSTDLKELNNYKFVLLILVFFCIIIIHPKVLQNIANFFLKKLHKEPIENTSTYRNSITILIFYIINWLVFGLALYFFINSFYDFPFKFFLYSTGAFTMAGIIGLLAVFAPAGLGVREGIIIIVLSYIIPAPIASIISLSSRIWLTFCELFLLAIIYCISLIKSKN